METFSTFAQTIFEERYAHPKDGRLETWPELSSRVSSAVLGAVGAPQYLTDAICSAIENREFIPGGRYLYATGRPFHQTQNCLLLRAQDSREGWSEIMQHATQALMTGAGIGIVYSDLRGERKLIKKTGGKSTGPLALMQMVNEAGRFIMQGGSRRSAIWAGLRWDHPDIFKFIHLKDWSAEVRALKAKDYSFPATLDGTNISVILNTEFFEAYHDEEHEKHNLAHMVYWETVRQMLKKAEPGFSIDCGVNEGEDLRNAPISASTNVLTSEGYVQVKDIVGVPTILWTGHQWARATFVKTGNNVPTVRVKMTGGREIICEPSHEFIEFDESRTQAQSLFPGVRLKISPPEIHLDNYSPALSATDYTLGFIYGDGSFIGKSCAEVTLCTDEKKLCRVRFDNNLISSETLVDSRGFHRIYFKSNSIFNVANKTKVPEIIKYGIVESKAAFIAGLFDADGSYQIEGNRLRLSSIHSSFLHDVRRLLEEFGIFGSVNTAGHSGFSGVLCYNLVIQSSYINKFRKYIPTCRLSVLPNKSYRTSKIEVVSVEPGPVEDVFCCDVGVSEHSFMAEGVIIANCTEITSRDDSDICNLGSINMAKVDSLEKMKQLVNFGTSFLLAGTAYSDVPYPKVDQVRQKNRRLGLGLMGLHEWLLKRGKRYGPDAELEEYLKIYAKSTEIAADWADRWGLSRPNKTRAVAPNGTIGIVAETTTSIEPIFCVAYKRRYLKGTAYNYQYVVDPTAKRLVASGIPVEQIEDAYSLAADVERRVAFQAWVQKYVDHAISSTINLPAWGSSLNNESTVGPFGDMLMKYLPDLRGVTCYPDGARDGQPLTACSFEEAIKSEGEIHYESKDVCSLKGGGESCGA